jgi:iron complex outermembrane receptor protein
LGEIVVTAEHRRENAQTTPIALSVYGGDILRKTGTANLYELSAMAPDLGFTQTEGKSIITIRGISSRDTTEVGDPAITVSTDGFYLNRPYSLSATLYDLDRVEVLRGPQGTLSGRNWWAGRSMSSRPSRPTSSKALAALPMAISTIWKPRARSISR